MKENNIDMEKYWSNQSDSFLTSKDAGLGAVLYSGMPAWFNKFYDKFQNKAFDDLVHSLDLNNKKALDVGCGVGRWAIKIKKRGADVTGIDFEIDRLKDAKLNPFAKGIKFEQMSASKMIYKNNTFDFSNSITVLQHIPYEEKIKAIQEMCRVTKKGGYIAIIELTDTFDDAEHVFPWPLKSWQEEFEKNGCQLVKSIGNEYAPLPRTLRRLKYLITKKKTISRQRGQVHLNKLEWITLRIVILLSYPIETICIKLLPPKLARHGGMLFKKV
jgi:ubiquinone/menaquinone biosynthesis C-methylase UbiE